MSRMRAPEKFGAVARHSSQQASDFDLRWLAAGCIAFLTLFNVALISLSIGTIPIRSVLVVGLLALFAILRPRLVQAAVTRHSLVFLLAGLLAGAGTFASFVNGADPGIVLRALLEVHVQAIITLLFATVAAQMAGPRAAIAAFVAAIGVTAGVAFLQLGGLEAAWSLREILGGLQGQDTHLDNSFLNRRPMGLSFSPIHLATQVCLAFAAYAGLRLWEGRAGAGRAGLDWRIITAIAMMVVVSVACATRSPILGAAIFLILYLVRQGDARIAIVLMVAGIALYIAAPVLLDAMRGTEIRVLRVGDNSSVGRLPLATFGMLLFLENPLGYGFDFSSQDYWTRFWPELYTLPSAGVVREAKLHNYFLNMLTTYGIGLLLAAPAAALLLWRSRASLLVFVPYLAHIVFHNSGPFWNDTLIWFVIGALSAMRPAAAEPAVRRERSYRPRPGFHSRLGA